MLNSTKIPLHSVCCSHLLISSNHARHVGQPKTSYNLKLGSVVWLSTVALLLFVALGTVQAQCSLSISRVTTSGCYSLSGTSRATVSVEVAWQNAPTNGYIVVTTGAQSRTITPGVITVNYGGGGTTSPTGSQTIVSPQVVAFEVNSTGLVGTVSAQFSNSATCSATSSFTAPVACLPTICQSGGLGGQVFNDYNANGIQEAGETNGVGGVTVTIYPCVGAPVSTTTDAYGIWTTSATLAYPVRVEFTTIPAAYAATSTLQGTGSRTTVQFISQSQCNVNLGINDPTDYCQDNPLLVIPTYISGDPLIAGGSTGAYRGLIGFPYNTVGTNLSFPMSFSIASSAVGALWAQTFNKTTKRLFSGATLRRHMGLGPGGLDAIYITNLTNQTAPPTPTYIKLSSLGIDVGSIPSNSDRGMSGDRTQPSSDPQSYSLIGTIGIGGMSISSDGQTLYLMNIRNNSLYALNLSTYNSTNNTADITLKGGPYLVPSMGCVNGVQRSWAVKYAKGKVYVGTVCDASSGSKSNLRAGIYAFDPATTTFSAQPVFDFPLTYPKGYTEQGSPNVTGWYPWNNTFNSSKLSPSSTSSTLSYPQPILSDIEFDIDGSMVLALMDRGGMQQGHRNYDLNGAGDYSGRVGGDILRAFASQGTFILENAAKAGPFVGSRPTNNQGPGFGEFYVDDAGVSLTGSGLYHVEIGLGSLALRPGSGEVVMGAMDPTGVNTPQPFTIYAGGIRRMNNTTGLVNDAFALYSSANSGTRDGTFGKATGLGDLDLLCDELQLLEIGNRVWLDDDKDGIQDACEPTLAGVNVSLYRSGTLVATTTTNANGEFYFNNLPTSSTVTGTASTTNLLPNTAYQLVFGTSNQFTGTILSVNNGKYALTTANSSAATANDLNDSDAQVATVAGITAPVISVTTGAYGFINHTLDVGFNCLPTTAGGISTTLASCNVGTGTAQSNARITVTNIENADRAFLTTTTSIPSYTATGSQPVSASTVSFTGLSNPTSSTGTAYWIVLYNGPSCYTVISTTLAQSSCCVLQGVTAVAAACIPATNQYSVSGTVSLTNSPAQSLTISDGTLAQVVSVSAGQSSVAYSFTGLTSGTGSHTITVSASNTTSCGASVSATYSAPASCTVGVALSVTPGVCQSATNGYSISGTLSLTNAVAGTATITDGAVSTTVTITAGATLVPYSLTGLTSGTGSHTVTVSYATKTTSATYVAPASCSVNLAITATPSACLPATNQYSVSGTLALTNAIAGTATITDGTSTTTVSVSAGQTSVPYTLAGLNSGTGSHTVTVSYVSRTASVTYTAPTSCTLGVALLITPGVCQSATNQYTLTGTLSLTNALAGTATFTDGLTSTTVAVANGQSSVAFSLTGLSSGTGSHTLVATFNGNTQSQTYTAPASCTVGVALSVVPGPCLSTTNSYSVSGILSLTNAIAGVATFTDGPASTTVNVPAGASAVAYYLNGLMSGTGTHTLVVTYAGQTTSLTYMAPVSCSVGVAISALPTSCDPVTNQYGVSGILSLTNAIAGSATITVGTASTTVTVNAGDTSIPYTLGGLVSDGASHTVVVTYANQAASAVYAAPTSCTVSFSLVKRVDKSRASIGEIISYTLVLTNTSSATASAITVRDSSTTGLSYVASSAVVPTGSSFAPGSPMSTWTVTTLAPAQSMTLIYQARADSAGILYNKVTVPGDTATVCTTVPFRVCQGDSYEFQLQVPTGRSSYQWYRNGTLIPGATTNVLSVTASGSYSLSTNATGGQCPDFSCCPFIIEEDSLPVFQASAIAATCLGTTVQANGQLVITGFNASYTYQYSAGVTFNEATSLSGARQIIPAGGVITRSLASPPVDAFYTIRVYNSAGCYADVTVMLRPTVCGCPAEVCVPFVIQQTKRGPRIGRL